MGAPEVQLELWEQQEYGFSIDLNALLELPSFPVAPIDWGGDIGINLKLTCPGSASCGNPNPCHLDFKQPLKIPGFSIKLPSLSLPSLPPLEARLVIPPKVILPLACPLYKDEGRV